MRSVFVFDGLDNKGIEPADNSAPTISNHFSLLPSVCLTSRDINHGVFFSCANVVRAACTQCQRLQSTTTSGYKYQYMYVYILYEDAIHAGDIMASFTTPIAAKHGRHVICAS